MDVHELDGFKPPYMAFQTFWGFIDELSSNPLPPRIDRSLMASKSGTDQANLINTLKAFALIDAEHAVQPLLMELTTADTDRRKTMLAELLGKYYAKAMRVAEENGTANQLDQCFRVEYSINGADTLRKSVTFFLHAARMSGVPMSPHFKATRSGQAPRGKPRKRATKRRPKDATEELDVHPVRHPEDQYRLDVRLRTGGTMTLTVNLNPLSLRGEDRTFFYDIVDKMADYQQSVDDQSIEPDSEGGQTATGEW